jgi:DNA-binding NarL/FixJ family response regulator
MKMMEKIKVHIVDDHEIQRAGLKVLLNSIPETELYGESRDGKEFLEFIKTRMPDVVLMDIAMPEMNGVEATKKAVEMYPEIKVLVLSTFEDDEHLVQMMDSGVKGYMIKNAEEEELHKAILLVNAGGNYFSAALSLAINKAFSKQRDKEKNQAMLLSPLSEREKEILQLICKGYTDKEMAKECGITHRTAGGHRNNLLGKTGCKNTATLIGFAFRTGLFKA